ncbi:MAG TPA: hypothetical protein VGL99_31130, partial [Chloroflexota bacterium]
HNHFPTQRWAASPSHPRRSAVERTSERRNLGAQTGGPFGLPGNGMGIATDREPLASVPESGTRYDSGPNPVDAARAGRRHLFP